jgi:acetoin utilization deacetylase AcuC-like enzyme
MSTLLVTHPACLDHLTPPGHPERPDRLRAVERALEDERFQALLRVEAPMASLETVALCHPVDYVTQIRDVSPKEGMVRLDADTTMSPGTFEAALRCVGGAVFAVDEVMEKRATNAFVATRPPGHHAETARPMGFCFFNHAAIAARYAQKRHGAGRVAVVDFDVHHGNGSQDIFWDDAIRAPALEAKPACTTTSSTRHCRPATAARPSGPRSRPRSCPASPRSCRTC